MSWKEDRIKFLDSIILDRTIDIGRYEKEKATIEEEIKNEEEQKRDNKKLRTLIKELEAGFEEPIADKMETAREEICKALSERDELYQKGKADAFAEVLFLLGNDE